LFWGLISKFVDKVLLIFNDNTKWVEDLDGVDNSFVKFRMFGKTFYKCKWERLHVPLPVNMIEDFLLVYPWVTRQDQLEQNLSHISIYNLHNIVTESKDMSKFRLNLFHYKHPCWSALFIVNKWLLLEVLSWMLVDQIIPKVSEQSTLFLHHPLILQINFRLFVASLGINLNIPNLIISD